MDNIEEVVRPFNDNDEQLDKTKYTESNGDYKYDQIITLVNAKIDSIKTEHEKNVGSTKGKLRDIHKRIEEINTRLQAIIAALGQTKSTVDANNKEIARLTEEKEKLETELGKLKKDKEAVDNELKAANEKLLENNTEIAKLTSELKQKKAAIDAVNQEIEALTATGTKQEEKIKELKEQYEKTKLADDKQNEDKITALKTQHDEKVKLLEDEKNRINSELSKANADLKQKETDYESLEESFTKLQERAQQNFQQVQDIEKERQQCADRIEEAVKEVTDTLQPQIDKLTYSNTLLERKLENAHNALDSIMTKLKNLKIEGADFTELFQQINELLKTTETSTTTIEGHVGIKNAKETTENSSNATATSTTFQGVPNGNVTEITNGFETNSKKTLENNRGLTPSDKKTQRKVSGEWNDLQKKDNFQRAMGIQPDNQKIPDLPVPGNMAVNKRMNDGDDGDDDDDEFLTTTPLISQAQRDVNKEINRYPTRKNQDNVIKQIKSLVKSDKDSVKSYKGGKRRKSKGKTRKVRKHATKKKRKPLVGGGKKRGDYDDDDQFPITTPIGPIGDLQRKQSVMKELMNNTTKKNKTKKNIKSNGLTSNPKITGQKNYDNTPKTKSNTDKSTTLDLKSLGDRVGIQDKMMNIGNKGLFDQDKEVNDINSDDDTIKTGRSEESFTTPRTLSRQNSDLSIDSDESTIYDDATEDEDEEDHTGGKRRKSKGKTRKVRKHATKKKRKPLVGGKKRKQTRKRRSRKAKKANKKK
jgi:predicted  nucleic acid-binding Zn-ribbon protein